MSAIKVEFFHDVLCSYCFAFSPRMRQLVTLRPEIELQHRSFALLPSAVEFEQSFPSREEAKEEILSHWAHANENDDAHRFNIEGMRKTAFLFPISTPALLACEAAKQVAGQAGYWDLFDALQKAFFVDSRNVEEEEVLASCVQQVGIDVAAWRAAFTARAVKEDLQADLQRAVQLGIHVVPSLVINEKYLVSGALPLADLLQAVDRAAAEEQSK